MDERCSGGDEPRDASDSRSQQPRSNHPRAPSTDRAMGVATQSGPQSPRIECGDTAEPSEEFPRSARLTTPADYSRARSGQRRSSAHLSLWAVSSGQTRLGLAISRKIGKSHDRQLWKRRVRDIFRRHRAPFLAGFDHVIVARPGAAQLGFADLLSEISQMLSKVRRV